MDRFNTYADHNGFIDRSRTIQPSLMGSPRRKVTRILLYFDFGLKVEKPSEDLLLLNLISNINLFI